MGDPLSNDKRYKVILWATGTIGRFAIRTILNRPNLELARCLGALRIQGRAGCGHVGRAGPDRHHRHP